jgi:hypothetical protein
VNRILPIVALLAGVATGCSGLKTSQRTWSPFAAKPAAGKSEAKTLDNAIVPAQAVARPQSPPTEPKPVPPPALPPLDATPLPTSWPQVYGDEHRRETPTVRGERLDLRPADTGIEKAIELARQNEQLQAEIRALQAKVAVLEQSATAREEAIAESVREVEAATVEVIRAKGDLQEARKTATALREQLLKAERDEFETLKLIAAALEKALAAPKESKE